MDSVMESPLLRQTWTASGVLINMFGHGLVLGYPTSLLPALQTYDSTIKSDLNTSSWLGSIVGVAGIAGFIQSSFIMGSYGRRIAHLLSILPAIVGWVLIYFATNIPMLMVGRFLGGFAMTASVSLGAVAIGEFTCPKYRGVFLNLKNASVCMGAMMMHIIARYFHWRTNALISIIPFVIAFVITYTWPESPAWLASKQRYEASETAFYWLRGKQGDARREIEEIFKTQKVMLSKREKKLTFYENVADFFRKFTQKDFIMPSLVMVLATAVLELSGRHIFPTYAIQIVAEITGETSESMYCTLALDIIISTSAVIASIVAKKLNRRTLLFSTGFSAVFVLLFICLYHLLIVQNVIVNDIMWIRVVLLIIYCSLANLGCAPIPLALVGEVFPLAHREVGVTISGIWISICLIAGLYSTPHLIANIGLYGYFTVFGSIMGIALLILYFIMPETKDRTLLEIENLFRYGKYTGVADDDEEVRVKMI